MKSVACSFDCGHPRYHSGGQVSKCLALGGSRTIIRNECPQHIGIVEYAVREQVEGLFEILILGHHIELGATDNKDPVLQPCRRIGQNALLAPRGNRYPSQVGALLASCGGHP